MRKFKLIQTYQHPTVKLEVGMVAEQQGSIYRVFALSSITFGREIENYPQYWEEIKELHRLYNINDMEAAFERGEESGLSDFNNKYQYIDFKSWIQNYEVNKDS